MTSNTVCGLWRFPVKSMGGERLEQAEVTERGMVGDRAYALIDTETGKVVSAKSVKLFPNVLNCKATFVTPPRADAAPPPVRFSLPDGTSLASDSHDFDAKLSAYFGRKVTLAQDAPEDFTVDQYLPDLESTHSAGGRGTVVAQKLGAALFAQLGMESPVEVGSFFDGFPLSVLTTSTIARLTELRPESSFDERRFRMNVTVKTEQPGFIENDWIGRELKIGDSLRLKLALRDPRCVMTTLAQDDLAQDTEVLRTLVRHNRIQVANLGQLPCAGVYAVVAARGTVKMGDQVAFV